MEVSAMELNYKQIAEQLSLELIDIEVRLGREGNAVNALLCSLITLGVITKDQYEDKVKQVQQI
jgi:hypothetical protein